MGEVKIEAEGIKIGAIFIKQGRVERTDDSFRNKLLSEIEEIVKEGKNEEIKKMVRNMLRFGKYKPSGRGKPASEYLIESAIEGNFPFINNFVDSLNFVSLKSGLPISLIDIEKAESENFKIRRGRRGESYVFNISGQVLELEDLLLTATLEADEAIATPVKDSLKTKIDDKTREMAALIYSPKGLENILYRAIGELSGFYSKFGEVYEQEML
ncbi:MAG: phenylalanine--tRNA ligase beta subunit-related protein [Acidobacteriota bacterium]